ncbi:DNA primase [Oceanivirga miroungae]|uniref:DNA primase n=1 Tax=Oceanivirga miroungae TaxID=1130046 RepID=A0A6I8M6B4_9FUSO|nr:DNA primase [Oceanivirga miroungae]VWL85429.1 DNA primase [Oceanivirga miroungae]
MKIRDKLLEKIDIVDFISKYVDLSKSGSNYKGLSPFKEENTPSFVVSPSKNIFKDFSSNKGGDAIKFYSLIKNISYKDAMLELAKEYDIKISNYENKYNKNSKYYDLLDRVNLHFNKNLEKNEKALDYLKSRSYNEDDIRKFGLGYASKSFIDLLNNFDNEILLELGLITKKENKVYDSFIDRITFPIYNLNRKIVGFGARILEDNANMPKYLNSQESIIFKKSNELFGIYDSGEKIKEFDAVILVEGFFDVLRLHKNAIVNTVASLGTSLSNNQAYMLSKLTKNIVIAYDDDTAGFNAKIRSINILNRYGFNIKVMSLNKMAKDPDEFITKYGKEKFIELLNESCDGFDFLYDYYSKNLDVKKTASKMEIINKMQDYFSTISNKIYFDIYLKRLSEKLDLSISSLSYNIKFIDKKENIYLENIENDNKRKVKKTRTIYDNIEELEEYTMLLLYYDKSLIRDYKNFNFSNENEEIFKKLLEENTNIREILNYDFFNNAEDKNKFFYILSKIDKNEITDDFKFRVYVEWVSRYMKSSLDDILNLVYSSNFDNMSKEEYNKYLEYNKKLKNLKLAKNIHDVKKIFYEYLEYEGEKKL